MRNNNLLFYAALVLAVWFALTAWFWAYWVNLVIAYPFGLVSLAIWSRLKKDKEERTIWIVRILGIGLLISLGMLVYLLIWD